MKIAIEPLAGIGCLYSGPNARTTGGRDRATQLEGPALLGELVRDVTATGGMLEEICASDRVSHVSIRIQRRFALHFMGGRDVRSATPDPARRGATGAVCTKALLLVGVAKIRDCVRRFQGAQ